MAAPLRAVRDHPERALALVRVSRERDGMVSPEIQDTAIRDYAARTGRTVVHRLEGLDESGSKRASPWWARLDEAVAMVERGEIDVVLVWKFSRVARHRLRWAVALDRVEQAGGRIESATEQVDTTTSTGRFTRGMLAELQAFEAERIGEQWREAHARRLAHGLPSRGGDRFGYVRKDTTYVPDEATGPVLACMYGWFVDGWGFSRIATALNDQGVTTLSGGPWSRDRVTRVLDSGFGAGQLVAGRGAQARYVPGVHPPVVDADVWAAYLSARDARRGQAPATGSASYPLSGLVRCGDCGGPMHAARLGRHAGYAWLCSTWASRRGCRCVSITQARAEAAVRAWLEEFDTADVAAVARREAAERTARAVAASDVDDLARQAQRLTDRLTRLTLGWTDGTVPDAAYAPARDDLERALADVTSRLDAVRKRAQEPDRPAPGRVRAILTDWDTLAVPDLRDMLAAVVHEVVVHRPPGNQHGQGVTLTVVPAWDAP